MDEFFERLRQRKIVQWALAYVAASFALIQVLDIVAQRFGWPEQAVRFLIIALVIGFFVTLVLAWYHGERGAQRVTGTELLILALLLTVGGALLWRVAQGTHVADAVKSATSPAASADKSIAVLPFANLSRDPDNTYFADGIQDEILTRLAKIGTLKVISRTSTRQYAATPGNLAQIAKQLGVAYILEGSVQKAADTMRINVQLIRADSDSHLWAETYDRKLNDIFGVESEVATAIGEALNATLSGAEKRELAVRATNNAPAYEAYLRGVALFERPDIVESDLQAAAASLETAVRLDPEFALAWAWLSKTDSLLFSFLDVSQTRRDRARTALENALRLQPELTEVQFAQAYYAYWVERDYETARQRFEQLRVKSPNNVDIPYALALIARRQGRWDESIARFNEASELDPRNARTLLYTAVTHAALRQFLPALKLLDRVEDITPGDKAAIEARIDIHQALGQLDQADATLALLHADASDSNSMVAMTNQLLFRRRFAAGIELMRTALSQLTSEQHEERAYYSFTLGEFQRLSGETAAAEESYAQALVEHESLLHDQPNSPFVLGALALNHAALGHREAALKYAAQAIAEVPTAKDALTGPLFEEYLARVRARLGDKDEAITILQRVLNEPYQSNADAPLTPAFLRLDPDWDNLRDDPRFQALLNAPGSAANALTHE